MIRERLGPDDAGGYIAEEWSRRTGALGRVRSRSTTRDYPAEAPDGRSSTVRGARSATRHRVKTTAVMTWPAQAFPHSPRTWCGRHPEEATNPASCGVVTGAKAPCHRTVARKPVGVSSTPVDPAVAGPGGLLLIGSLVALWSIRRRVTRI